MNKRIIGNFLKNMEISVMGKKMKLKLDEIKAESFVTSLDPQRIVGGLLPTDPDACGTNTCQNYTKVQCDTTPQQCAGYTQVGCGGTVGCTWQGCTYDWCGSAAPCGQSWECYYTDQTNCPAYTCPG
jgi:hypothetical protein